MTKRKRKKSLSVSESDQRTSHVAERKPNRKERLAMEAARNEEFARKRRWIYGMAVVIAGLTVLISFSCNSYYGQSIYDIAQLLCFVLMGISGVLFVFGSRYEVNPKQQRSKRSMGLIFVAVALGVLLMEIIQILMK